MTATSQTLPDLPGGAGPDARPRDAALREHLRTRLPAALAVIVGAALLISYSVGQWRSMYVPSWDLAIFSELAKAYSHLGAPIVPIKGEGYNLLGDHFHPILILLAPVWWVAPTPLALLAVQDLLLAASAWPITRLAARTVGPVAGAVLGLTYVLSWGFQGAVAAQFHEIAFAVPMLAWASAAFVERRWWDCAAWCVPLVLVKEDLGLTVFMAGLAIAWRGWSRRTVDVRPAGADPAQEADDAASPGSASLRTAGTPSGTCDQSRSLRLIRRVSRRAADAPPFHVGLGLALFGFAFFVLTVLVLIPLMSQSGTWEYGIGGNAGDGSSSGGGGLASLLSPEVKRQTLAVLALTAGLIGLASPWFWLIAPTIAWRFLSGKEFYWEWESWHYNAILIPIVMGAMLDVVTRARRALPWRRAPRYAWIVAAVGVVLPVSVSVWSAPDLALAQMTREGWGRAPARAEAAQEVLEAVPDGATVETDLGLLAYLVPDHTVYWVGTGSTAVDYVVVDQYSSAWGGRPPADAAAWATERTGVPYTLVLSRNGYQVAKRNE